VPATAEIGIVTVAVNFTGDLSDESVSDYFCDMESENSSDSSSDSESEYEEAGNEWVFAQRRRARRR
jgi:hypothetical protein